MISLLLKLAWNCCIAQIWRERNRRQFRRLDRFPADIIMLVKQLVLLTLKAKNTSKAEVEEIARLKNQSCYGSRSRRQFHWDDPLAQVQTLHFGFSCKGNLRSCKGIWAEPVGVFVDDDLDTILRASDASNIEYVQLHGDLSRAAFPKLVQENRIMYVLHANEEGDLQNQISDEDCSLVDWVLVDSAKGGSGKGFNWARFKLPSIKSKHGWLLAGGINPNNVCEAISTLKPHGVDVSSGICGPDGIQKNQSQIFSFMNAVRSSPY
ncbi:N-(5'-phosphoribosyl)anthranilate isomerase 1 [Hibiscus syriacus]|uniref:phosphoribosylanthranilate isomerase n=1 Tax=Hibiscus syriacus TaxID=106335 RepID=A0A6A3BQQ6_HIBSY|nr:N-(5'-phosphoribosyl)anthranilate isomerase 1 [Hibiscus syriacus]